MSHSTNLDTLAAYSAYDLPSVAALILYFHVTAGYPVRSTWLKSISVGNYSSWPGLTLSNATKYCPSADATIMGHLVPKPQRSDALNLKLQKQVHLKIQSPRSAPMNYLYKSHPSVNYTLMTQVAPLSMPAVETNTS